MLPAVGCSVVGAFPVGFRHFKCRYYALLVRAKTKTITRTKAVFLWSNLKEGFTRKDFPESYFESREIHLKIYHHDSVRKQTKYGWRLALYFETSSDVTFGFRIQNSSGFGSNPSNPSLRLIRSIRKKSSFGFPQRYKKEDRFQVHNLDLERTLT